MKGDYISWNTYFMEVAKLTALRSKDPNCKVGCCIMKNNHLISTGYNGFPTGVSDDEYPWEKEGNFLDTKYPYVCHAELNAILNASASVKGSTVYVTRFPCNECAKAIIQSGVKHIVYLLDKHPNDDTFLAAKRMFQSVGITYEQYQE